MSTDTNKAQDAPRLTDAEAQRLCLELARADSEAEVITVLEDATVWDADELWVDYGKNENNYSQIGNQQGDPAAALGEKFTNSIDARLMRAVLADGVDPEGNEEHQPPSSTREVVESYFDVPAGRLARLRASKRQELAEGTQFIATGDKQTPCYTIIDNGEGQLPWKLPETFLSLGESNKLRIPFVQGEFNMGGTGALEFAGEHGLQLVISRRAPELVADSQQNPWGFTIVRRFPPEGNMRHSVYRYLTADTSGNMLQFQADSLPLCPGAESNEAQSEPMEFGSLVKLYDYDIGSGLRTNILFDLYNRMSFLLPGIGLPVRFYERRKGYSGHSMETTMAGLNVRLEDDKRSNLEDGFPTSHEFTVGPSTFRCRVYAFQKDDSRPTEKYREKSEGIAFTLNGQTHGALSARFFSRKAVGMSYLKGSLMVIVNCDDMEGRHREQLFQNSRDRLSNAEVRRTIEDKLEEILSDHQGLRELRNKRRQDEIQERVEDDGPLEDILNKVINDSPTLSSLFGEGERLTDPFDLRDEKKEEEGRSYEGQRFPTEFEIHEKHREKKAPINQKRIRVAFDTDAVNDYFDREVDPGTFTLKCGSNVDYTYDINLWNGRGTLNIDIPKDASIGDEYSFITHVTDPTRVDPFVNEFTMVVGEKRTSGSGRKEGSSDRGTDGGSDGNPPSGLSLPQVREVKKEDWDERGYSKSTALEIVHTGERDVYDFYVNVDNIYLLNEIKQSPKDSPKDLLTAQFKYGLVLLALGLLRKHTTAAEDADVEVSNDGESGMDALTIGTDGGYDPDDIESFVKEVTEAIAPMVLPTIDRMAALDTEP